MTDAQTEIMNKKFEEVLRCFVDHKQSNWEEHLMDDEVAYSQSVISVTTYSPFYLRFGFDPSTLPFYTLRCPSNDVSALTDWLFKLRAPH